ncbi:thioredoxin family protein [Psychroflexus aestuariivivens]|uniref:thioredoxin family protein n=1 Tax=Psychroflexus aestuariivivens TaxID=1795040 RepID=UPI000FD71C06|nr:thioredoxin family protein [Psychroflexus aestuariivivens]
MKTLSYYIIVLALIGFSKTVQSQDIYFYDGDWGRTLEFAEEQERLIFVDVYAIWCRPCREMSKYVFTNPHVGKYFTETFINKKINAERGVGIDLVKKYNVKALPTLLILDSDENLIAKTTGYQSSNQLLRFAKSALRKYNRKHK